MGGRAYDGLEGVERAVIRAGCGMAPVRDKDPVRGKVPVRGRVPVRGKVHGDGRVLAHGKVLARGKARDGVCGGVSDGRGTSARDDREDAEVGRTASARLGWGSGGPRGGGDRDEPREVSDGQSTGRRS